MMIGKVLVTVLVVSMMAMAMLQNVEGGRDMAPKESKVHNPQIFNQNLGYNYKPKEEYGSDGYGYKDGDCDEYGKCDKPKDEYDCDRYRYKDRDCDEYGNCDKSSYNENDEHQLNSYKKQMPMPKEVTGKYRVGQNYP